MAGGGGGASAHHCCNCIDTPLALIFLGNLANIDLFWFWKLKVLIYYFLVYKVGDPHLLFFTCQNNNKKKKKEESSTFMVALFPAPSTILAHIFFVPF